MPIVRRRDEARDQLEDIWLYIARDKDAAADRLLDRIDAALFDLADRPMMGRARPELAPELRSFVVGSYVLFYRPQPDGILLVAVLHGSRDIGPDDFPDPAASEAQRPPRP
jgi:toxin ParE1/3/4